VFDLLKERKHGRISPRILLFILSTTLIHLIDDVHKIFTRKQEGCNIC